MNGTPKIGQGVAFRWGRDTLRGEVTEVPEPDRVVVGVPVEGASGEELETVPVTFLIEQLAELPAWQVTESRGGLPTPGADATKAWYVDARRDGEEARVEVRLSGSAAAVNQRLPAESRDAVRTHGRSAVEKYSYRYRLPRVLVVATTGVFELAD